MKVVYDAIAASYTTNESILMNENYVIVTSHLIPYENKISVGFLEVTIYLMYFGIPL